MGGWTEFIIDFAVIALVLLFGYIVFRVVVRRDYERYGRLKAGALVLEFIVFAAHANLCYLFLPVPWPELPPLPSNKLQLIVGFGLAALGVLLTLWTMGRLGFKKVCGQPSDKLHIVGFYRWSRNPQLVFYGLALLGLVALWPAPYAIIWLLVYAVLALWMVRSEEEHLVRIFGVEYQRYCEQVSRFIPRQLSRG